MLKFLSRLKPAIRQEVIDAQCVYNKTMRQSRQKSFYGPTACTDDYDGRMEVLCLHLSLVLHALRKFGDNGARLSQAIYDVMIEDFDIALREEGLSDTGVKVRIKPLAKMFFARAKSYAGALDQDRKDALSLEQAVAKHMFSGPQNNEPNRNKISCYARDLSNILSGLELGEIAKGGFEYPHYA